uniref:Medium-chain specific acyl-CoA dehydrogenase, mitochondrial n=1 Tax=Parascaris univalens TaxID=6257 RepID=A0A915A6W0_PARUN
MRVLPEWRRAQRRTPSPVAVPLKTVPTVIHNPSHRTHTKFSAKFDSHRKTAKNDVASARSSKQVKKNEDELEVDATERSRSESSKNYSKSSKSASSARKKRKRLMENSIEASSSTIGSSHSTSSKKSKQREKRDPSLKRKKGAARHEKKARKEEYVPSLTRSLVEKLLPIAMKEGEEATKVTAVYDPWMPLEKLAERSSWLYSSEVARLNTIMSISYFIGQRRSNRAGTSGSGCSSVCIVDRAQRTTFSVKDRNKQSNDSFDINDYPQKNSIPSRI